MTEKKKDKNLPRKYGHPIGPAGINNNHTLVEKKNGLEERVIEEA